MRVVRPGALVALLALAIAACGGASKNGDRPAPSAGQSTDGSHVFIIVLENREFDQVIGNRGVPYLNRLAGHGALAVRYFAITHPSLPNYLAIVGGSTFGIQSDCTACSAQGSSLALQLEEAGISWRAYMEGMPSVCFSGAYAGGYAKKHNPFAYFPSIRGDPDLCANLVPGAVLSDDLAGGNLASFSWITPNLCHDAHDCGIGAADRYLSGLAPQLLARLGPQGFLIITFDEGVTDRGCCQLAHGGRIATILAGPGVRQGAQLRKPYDHYSLLRTLEDAFALPHLRNAAGANPIREAFSSFPSLP
jgi:phosphatidylinositol-3-phosphatase